MKALFLAAALGCAALTSGLIGAPTAQARQNILPPTDDAAASAARQALAGKSWTGQIQIDRDILNMTYTLGDSGRGHLKAITPDGLLEATLLWGVIAAGPDGRMTVAMIMLQADDSNALETDEDLIVLEGAVTGNVFKGTFKFEGPAMPVELTAP